MLERGDIVTVLKMPWLALRGLGRLVKAFVEGKGWNTENRDDDGFGGTE